MKYHIKRILLGFGIIGVSVGIVLCITSGLIPQKITHALLVFVVGVFGAAVAIALAWCVGDFCIVQKGVK